MSRRLCFASSFPGIALFGLGLFSGLLRAVDELHMSRFISHNTWNTLAKKFSGPQIVEVIIIVGDYTQMAMFQNTLGQQPYKGDPRMPPDAVDRP